MSDDVARTSTSQSVSVVTDAPIPTLFDFLVVPANHVRLDGSGSLLAAGTGRLTEIGQTFTVQMIDAAAHRYSVENHVVDLVPDVLIAWRPARPGDEPVGVRWQWEFDIGPKGETVITHTCDWADASASYLLHNTLPRVSADAMRTSIRRLIDLASSYA